MILPIRVHGDEVLRHASADVSSGFLGLDDLISNMFDTVEFANGIGIAAPQIGNNIRIFVTNFDFKRVFINPLIIHSSLEECVFVEGCLSIPNVFEEVSRSKDIILKYQDERFVEHLEEFSGIAARVIQHEYDHLDGILFIDLI